MPVIANRNSKKPVADRATTLVSAIRNHKVRKTCHRESSGGHGARYPSLRLQKRNFRFQGLPWNLASYKTWCSVKKNPAKKKPSSSRQSHPGDDAWSQSGPCKRSAGMPRFGFENLYAPPHLGHCVSWEIRQFVAHFATQRNSGVLTILISGFPFSNTTWSLTPDATVHMLDSPECFHSMLAHFLRCLNR